MRKDHSFDDDELGQNNFQSKHLPTSEVVQDSPVIGRRATRDFQLRVRKGQVKCFSPDFTPVTDQEAFFFVQPQSATRKIIILDEKVAP